MLTYTDCAATDYSASSGLSPLEIEKLMSGELCGSLMACTTCALVPRGEQAKRALTLTGANIPLLRTRVGELT